MMTPLDKVQVAIKDMEFHINFYRVLSGVPFLSRRMNPYSPCFEERKAVFIHIPKAAGSSIASALFGGNVGHKPYSRFHAYAPKELQEYFTFSFVRNPWDRLYSAYRYFAAVVGQCQHRDHRWASEMLAGKPDFQSFVSSLGNPAYRRRVLRYDHFRDQSGWVMLGKNVGVDYLGRFETIQTDFDSICDQLGIDQVELPRLRESHKGGHYTEVFTPEMALIVGDIYQKDIINFGYQFGSGS